MLKIYLVFAMIMSLTLTGCSFFSQDLRERGKELNEKISYLTASQKVDYIDFKAIVLTEENLEKVNSDINDELSGININSEETIVLLTLNNHRKDLSNYKYEKLVFLDDKPATQWQLLASQMGGHHSSGIIRFKQNKNPKVLTIHDLPVGEVTLTFNAS